LLLPQCIVVAFVAPALSAVQYVAQAAEDLKGEVLQPLVLQHLTAG
jgi:hypothetical protein